MDKVYLDYAATTPIDSEARKAMEPYFSQEFGNTMSLHSFGQSAKSVLEGCRKKIAKILNAEQDEIYFTASATESNNTVLKGLPGRHIIISPIEHPCIMETANWLEKNGAKVTRLKTDRYGFVNLSEIEETVTEQALVSVIHASNEIGTLQDIAKIGEISRSKNALFHTDASQSFGKIPIDVKEMKIDLLTASSQKIYGPKGAGLLFVKRGIKLEPLLHGGGQESGLRSSTINLPAIVGFAKAAEIAQERMEADFKKISALRDKLISGVLKIEGAYLTGHPEERLPNIASFYFDFVEGESLLLQLDLDGIAVSTGSACSSDKLEPSHVLLALGLEHEQAHGSLRVSLGRSTTEEEIGYFLDKLEKAVEKFRTLSPIK